MPLKSRIMNGKRFSQRRQRLQMMRCEMNEKLSAINKIRSYNNEKFWITFMKDLCENSSFHGLHYFFDGNRSTVEKIIWMCLLLCALFGSIYSVITVLDIYMNSTTETVIETTHFSTANVAFPSVTICDQFMIDWSKVIAHNNSLFQEYTNETETLILKLLRSLASLSVHNFDHLHWIIQYRHLLPKLESLPISDLLLKLGRSCPELFKNCYWQGVEINCCDIMELQKTEFGYCYSFNSDLSEKSKTIPKEDVGVDAYWRDENGIVKPRRTKYIGSWSGLRLIINSMESYQIPPKSIAYFGIKILINDPREVKIGRAILLNPGEHGLVNIEGSKMRSTEEIRLMDVSKRNCLFANERKTLGLPYYSYVNCKMDCLKFYMHKYCKCIPDFLVFEFNDNNSNYPPCTLMGLSCLQIHWPVLKKIYGRVSLLQSPFVDDIKCDCPWLCSFHTYRTDVSISEHSYNTSEAEVDVHFGDPFCILFRQNEKFKLLDLIVSFGGTTGLFLGGSLLSCVEIVYFFTLRLYYHKQNWKKKQENSISNQNIETIFC